MIATELDSQISDIRQKILDNQREIISREHTIEVLIRRKSELQAERDRSTGLKVREIRELSRLNPCDPCEGCKDLDQTESMRAIACNSKSGLCPPGFPHGGRS